MKSELMVLACAVTLGLSAMFISAGVDEGDPRTVGAVGTYADVVGGDRNALAP